MRENFGMPARLTHLVIGALTMLVSVTCTRDSTLSPTDVTLRAPRTGGPSAASLPSGITESLVTDQLPNSTAIGVAPDGRIFVAEQSGRLRVIKNGVLLPTPFVSLSVDGNGERGLLGIAFHPNFASTPWVYVYYTTAASPVHNRISRFLANGDVASG